MKRHWCPQRVGGKKKKERGGVDCLVDLGLGLGLDGKLYHRRHRLKHEKAGMNVVFRGWEGKGRGGAQQVSTMTIKLSRSQLAGWLVVVV